MTGSSRDRARRRAIRALMTASGLKYTEAAKALDDGRARVRVEDREFVIAPDGTTATPVGAPAGGAVPIRATNPDLVPVFLSPGREITDPEEAEALGLTGEAIRRQLGERSG